MKKIIFIIAPLTLFFTCQLSFAANWVLFFKSAAELDFSIEKDSVHNTSDGTLLVWEKLVPQDNAKFKPWIELTELKEVDCNRKRYKTLQKEILYENKPIEQQYGESQWIYLDTSDLDTAFYKTVCTK